MASHLVTMTERIVHATADASVAVLNAAIEAFYEADFCSNSHSKANELRRFAVRAERVVGLIEGRSTPDPADQVFGRPLQSTVQG